LGHPFLITISTIRRQAHLTATIEGGSPRKLDAVPSLTPPEGHGWICIVLS
jgi:hypothetical protein